jgi:hypothetical protein
MLAAVQLGTEVLTSEAGITITSQPLPSIAHATLQLHGNSNELLPCVTVSLAQALQSWLSYTCNPMDPLPETAAFCKVKVSQQSHSPETSHKQTLTRGPQQLLDTPPPSPPPGTHMPTAPNAQCMPGSNTPPLKQGPDCQQNHSLVAAIAATD